MSERFVKVVSRAGGGEREVLMPFATFVAELLESGSFETAGAGATAAAAVIASSITNGDTTHAPSGDAVYDALAGKADVSATKVYRALLTRTDSMQTSGSLIVGHRYQIYNYETGDDFMNVGAASNGSDVRFVASGTTPTDFTHGSVVRDLTLSAPVATVLENTFNDDFEWVWADVSDYEAYLTGAFPEGKTFIRVNSNGSHPYSLWGAARIDNNSFYIIDNASDDSGLSDTPVEVLVYP